MAERADGWSWLDVGPHGTDDGPPDDLARVFASCFRSADGARVLGFLRTITLERALGADASEAQLRHLEGQRQLVSLILALVRRGRG